MATNNSVNVGLAGSTGTGNFVGANTPTLITPVIGAATGTSLNFGAAATNGLIGVTSGATPAAGVVGEFVQGLLTFGTPVSLTTDTPANITTISLTAGEWDVWGTVGFLGGATTLVQYQFGWTSQTSATAPTRDFLVSNSYAGAGAAVFANANIIFNVQTQRVSLSATTTLYLSVQVGFSIDTCSAYGNIRARRRK